MFAGMMTMLLAESCQILRWCRVHDRGGDKM